MDHAHSERIEYLVVEFSGIIYTSRNTHNAALFLMFGISLLLADYTSILGE